MKKALSLAVVLLLVTAIHEAATITVTSPTAGMTVCCGTPVWITWTSSKTVLGEVYIRLYQSSGTKLTIAASTPNDGSYLWTIPCNALTQGNFKVRVGAKVPPIFDDSEGFTIKLCQTLKMVSPNVGENWQMDSVRNIKWQASSGMTGAVKLILLQNGSSMGIIASGLPVTGSHAWLVGHTDKGVFRGQGFRVRVTKDYPVFTPKNPIADESDNAFSIYKLE